jgi:hypothetical protein
MSGGKPLSPERIAEIKAFKDVDILDCPELTGEELKKLRPRHPENSRVQIGQKPTGKAWRTGSWTIQRETPRRGIDAVRVQGDRGKNIL